MPFLIGLLIGSCLTFAAPRASAADTPHDPVAAIGIAFNVLVDTIAATDPTFRERFTKNLQAASK